MDRRKFTEADVITWRERVEEKNKNDVEKRKIAEVSTAFRSMP